MKLTGVGSRIDRLELELGNPDQDVCRIVEILQAIADGTDVPHVVTPSMRQIVARELLALAGEGVEVPARPV